jgi:hypothetical protein
MALHQRKVGAEAVTARVLPKNPVGKPCRPALRWACESPPDTEASMSRQRKHSESAAPSQDEIDAKTPLPRSRYLVYAALAVVTFLITSLSCIGTLPSPINDWAAWQAEDAGMQLGRAGFFTGMLFCLEFLIVRTIYLRVAQRRSAGDIAKEVAGVIVGAAVETAGASGGRPSKNL